MKTKAVFIAALLGLSGWLFVAAPTPANNISIDKVAFSAAHADSVPTAAASGYPIIVAAAPTPVAIDVTKEMENKAFLDLLWASIKGWKGLGAMGVAAGLTQMLAMFMMTPMFAGLVRMKKPIEEWMGKWRLALVCSLSMISGICMLIATGLDWKAALVHSSTLTAFQVLFHQMFKQGTEKPKAA